MVINPEISINYVLPFQMFSRGSRLGARRSGLGIFVLAMQGFGWLSAIALAVIVAVNAASGHEELAKPLLPMFVFPAFLIAIPPILRLISYRNLRGPLPELHMQFEADEHGFRRTIERTGDASWRWDATHAILSDASVVTIAVRKGAFVFIPRAAMTDAQFVRLKQMFAEAKARC
jgi:hypothetical protein